MDSERYVESGFRNPRELRPYDKNSRTHSEAQIEEVRASIRQFGFTSPAIIDDDNLILAGHARTVAATLEELEEIPVRIVHGLTAAEKMAYVIADNKLALNADWNLLMLRDELALLRTENLDMLGITGFSDVELDQIFSTADNFDAAGHWTGMPDYAHENQEGFRALIVHFKDQAAVDDFARLVGQELGPNTKYIWHPRQENERYIDTRYRDAG
jgi:hypothetical protein